MNEDLERLHDMLVAAFMALSPAVFVAVFAILLGLLLWALRQALRNLRIVQAVAKAPLVDLRSTVAGLVKIRGTAHPPEPRPGRAPSSIVWYSRHRRSGNNTSTLSTTDNFVIRDAHGDCAVNTGKTTILPAASLATEGFLDKSRSSVERALYTGDAVFALGALRFGLPPLSGVAHARCQLVRSSGVLLVSGASEREAKVLHTLWFIVQAPLALLCLGLLGFGTWAHLIGYPPGNDGSAATFLEALRTTPWKGEAGPDHPLWLQTPAEPASQPPP